MSSNVLTLETRFLYKSTATSGPYAINTWHVGWNEALGNYDAAKDAARDAVNAFWTGDDNHDTPLKDFLSQQLEGTVEIRTLSHESPTEVWQDMEPLTMNIPVTQASLPLQVAACLTTKCPPHDGLKRQSFYNRIYLGPLNVSTMATNGNIALGFQEQVKGAVLDVLDSYNLIGLDHFFPVVYSPSSDTSGSVSQAWIDNRFDIQRRRAQEATHREIFST